MSDFKELVKNLYTSKDRELTPEKFEYIQKTYSNGKEQEFVKNFYATIGEDLTEEKLTYISDTYLKKKDTPSQPLAIQLPLPNQPINPLQQGANIAGGGVIGEISKTVPKGSIKEAALADKKKNESYLGALWNNAVGSVARLAGGAARATYQFSGNPVIQMERELLDKAGKVMGKNLLAAKEKEYADVVKGVVEKGRTSASSKEYERQIAEGFDVTNGLGSSDLKGVVAMLPQFISDMGLAAATGGGSFAIQGYDDALSMVDDMPEGSNISEGTRVAFGVGGALVVGALEKLGLDNLIKNPAAKKYVTAKVIKEATDELVKKGVKVTAEQFENVVKEKASKLTRKELTKIVATRGLKSAAVEGGTEAVQEGGMDLLKLAANKIEGKEIFDEEEMKNTAAKRYLNSLAAGGILGGIGGSVVSRFQNTEASIKDRLKDAKTVEDIDGIVAEINDNVVDGTMTQEEADNVLPIVQNFVEVSQKVPETLSGKNKVQAVDLINEREKLGEQLKDIEAQKAAIDPSFHPLYDGDAEQIQERIDEINNQLGELAKPEKNKVEEEITPPTDKQIEDDVVNERFATFKYKNESEVPDVFKDKISSKGNNNGVPFVRVRVPQSVADYELGKLKQQKQKGEEEIQQPIEDKKADIEKRREQELKERVVYDVFPTVEDGEFKIVGDPNNRIYRINENTGRPQELDPSNGLWSNTALAPNLFMESTKRSGFEKLKENINAKYDAELNALGEQQIPDENIQPPIEPQEEVIVEEEPEAKPQKVFAEKDLDRAKAKKVHQRVREMEAPSDAAQIALRYIADGGKVSEAAINEVAGSVKRARLNTGAKELKSNEAKSRDYYQKDGETLDELAHRLWENSSQEVSEIDIKDALMSVIGDYNTRLEAGTAYLEQYNAEYQEEQYYERLAEQYKEEFEEEQRKIEELFKEPLEEEILGLASEEHINNLIKQYENELNRENQELRPEGKNDANEKIGSRASGKEDGNEKGQVGKQPIGEAKPKQEDAKPIEPPNVKDVEKLLNQKGNPKKGDILNIGGTDWEVNKINKRQIWDSTKKEFKDADGYEIQIRNSKNGETYTIRTDNNNSFKGSELSVREKLSNYEKQIAEAYHKAKADGSNPELVKAVEQSLPTQEVKAEQPNVSESKPALRDVESTAKEGFTDGKDLNKMFADLKSKYGDKKGSALYEVANRLVNPNKNTIVEIRSNGVVVKEGDKYILKPFGNTDANSKKWTLYKGLDITDQFPKSESLLSKEQTKTDPNVFGIKKEPTEVKAEPAKQQTSAKPKEKAIVDVEKVKKIADFIRKGKIDDDILMSGVPFAKEVWNGAVEAMAKTVELTGDIAKAIEDGIAHIKKSDWYKSLSEENKAKAENRFNKEYSQEKINEKIDGEPKDKAEPKADTNFLNDKNIPLTDEKITALSAATSEYTGIKVSDELRESTKGSLDLLEQEGAKWVAEAKEIYNNDNTTYVTKMIRAIKNIDGTNNLSVTKKAVALVSLLESIDKDLMYVKLSKAERETMVASRNYLLGLRANLVKDVSLAMNAQRLIYKLYNGKYKTKEVVGRMVGAEKAEFVDEVVANMEKFDVEITQDAIDLVQKEVSKPFESETVTKATKTAPISENQVTKNKKKYTNILKNTVSESQYEKLKNEIRDISKKIICPQNKK